ncbi:MAG: MFS transporter [Kiloniellales bacterium]
MRHGRIATRTVGFIRHAPAAWARWWPVVLLGWATIGAYGSAHYSFGVLIGPIHHETGWSTGALSAAYSLGTLIAGLGAAVAGQALDRFGSRPVLLGSLLAGSASLLAAAAAGSVPLFVVGWGLGGGIIGAGMFYHVTMAVTTRLYPIGRPQAFARLTFIGGLASPIYFPVTALLVELWGWRDAIRVLVVLLILTTLPAALCVRGAAAMGPERADGTAAASAVGAGSGGPASDPASEYTSVRQALGSREVVQMVVMFALAMMAFVALQVHHIPAMQATGLSLATASTLGAVRGLLSLPGRAFLSPLVGRFGLPGAISVAYLSMLLGVVALLAAGHISLVIVFAVVTGLAFGTLVPLHGLYAAEVFGERRIGTLMGAQTAVVSVAAAAGPLILGLSVDLTEGYTVALGLVVILFALATALLVTRPRRRGVSAGESVVE